MGSCCSSSDRVEPADELDAQLHNESKGSRSSSETEYQGPVKNRSCTDIIFLLLLILFVAALGYLVMYCFKNGDIYRILNGYDNCGNVCGQKNKPLEAVPCFGVDYSKNRFLKITNAYIKDKDDKNINRQCATSCDDAGQEYRTVLNRCIPKKVGGQDPFKTVVSKTGVSDFLQEVSEDLDLCKMEILYLFLVAFGFSIVILILFRFLVGIVVWLVLIGAMIASVAGTVYLWILWKNKKEDLKNKTSDVEAEQSIVTSYLIYAIVATVVTVIIWLVIIAMRKRIKLVIQLFKEAGKSISSMPFLLLQPFITFLVLGGVIAMWLYFTLWIESSGFLKKNDTPEGKYFYKKDMTMKVARWYNLFALFWFMQFCIGCQHMVIAGAVSKWFFTRNKNSLGFPIVRGLWNVVRYHLGSVALGSFLIALVQMVRAVLKFIESQVKGNNGGISRCIFRTCQCCLYCFEKILQFLSRNAYIEIAMYGYSFCKAGQQAFKLLASNALRVAAINSVGDFVLFLGKAVVVTATVLVGIKMLDGKEGIQHKWIPLVLAAVFAYLVSHCFLTVYEMAIDTIFLCFCEDCEKNDGLSRPYYMSRGLMEFVHNSKKALGNLDSSGSKSEAWSSSSRQPTK